MLRIDEAHSCKTCRFAHMGCPILPCERCGNEHNEWSAYTVADYMRQLDDDALATMIVDMFLSDGTDEAYEVMMHDAVLSYLKEPYEQK